jgi:hypothetical protein
MVVVALLVAYFFDYEALIRITTYEASKFTKIVFSDVLRMIVLNILNFSHMMLNFFPLLASKTNAYI